MEHAYENHEAILGIAIMLVGLSVMNGVFLGAFTSVQSDAYRRHAQFADRYKLINASLVIINFFISILFRPLSININFSAFKINPKISHTFLDSQKTQQTPQKKNTSILHIFLEAARSY